MDDDEFDDVEFEGGDDDDDFGDGNEADDSDLFRSDSFNLAQYVSLDKMGLVERIKALKFNRVQELVGDIMCGDMILVGLRAYGWNHEKLVEEVLVGYDQVLDKLGVVLAKEGGQDLAFQDDKICYVCGQRSPTKRIPLSLRPGTANPLCDEYDEKAAAQQCPVCCMPLKTKKEEARGEEFSCPVCWNDVPMSESFALGCGHRFCNDCWRAYLRQRITEPGNVESCCSVCMEKDCKCPIPESVFSLFIRDTKLLRRYVEHAMRHFVASDVHYKWCPYPGCENAMFAETVKNVDPVVCNACGNSYCFNCSDPEIGDHRPCLCDMAKKWMEKATDEHENIAWLDANTKRCPKCHAAIEKNGGCMHMTCRKDAGGCGYEFCWLCRGPWSEHGSATGGYYQCNKYEKSAAKKLDDKAAETRKELEHYMFYYHRYDSHKMACKAAQNQKAKIEARREELVKRFHVPPVDTFFLNETIDALIQFRRALQYSYAYGYYIPRGSPQLELFQFSQENLEKYANHLQELFEMRSSKIEDFFKWKEDIVNFTRLTTKYLTNFSRGVAKDF